MKGNRKEIERKSKWNGKDRNEMERKSKKNLKERKEIERKSKGTKGMESKLKANRKQIQR